jgi:hypothetical protein
MIQPTSLPVPPPQPSQAAYGIAALNLFQVFNRSSYEGEFGVQAAPFNTDFPIKSWFDTSVTTGPVTYNVITGTNPAQVTTLTMDASQASAINLSGDYQYPAYAPSPETTAIATFAGTSQSVNAALICAYADAVTLSSAINGASGPVPVADPQAAGIAWNSETRRMWDVTVAGTNLVAAPLLAMMWANGIGAPGSWDLSTPADPTWVPAPEPDWSVMSVVATPIRPLLPNEQLQAGPLGMGVEIVRTDLVTPSTPASATGSGGLTGAQAAQLETIFNWILKQP